MSKRLQVLLEEEELEAHGSARHPPRPHLRRRLRRLPGDRTHRLLGLLGIAGAGGSPRLLAQRHARGPSSTTPFAGPRPRVGPGRRLRRWFFLASLWRLVWTERVCKDQRRRCTYLVRALDRLALWPPGSSPAGRFPLSGLPPGPSCRRRCALQPVNCLHRQLRRDRSRDGREHSPVGRRCRYDRW